MHQIVYERHIQGLSDHLIVPCPHPYPFVVWFCYHRPSSSMQRAKSSCPSQSNTDTTQSCLERLRLQQEELCRVRSNADTFRTELAQLRSIYTYYIPSSGHCMCLYIYLIMSWFPHWNRNSHTHTALVGGLEKKEEGQQQASHLQPLEDSFPPPSLYGSLSSSFKEEEESLKHEEAPLSAAKTAPAAAASSSSFSAASSLRHHDDHIKSQGGKEGKRRQCVFLLERELLAAQVKVCVDTASPPPLDDKTSHLTRHHFPIYSLVNLMMMMMMMMLRQLQWNMNCMPQLKLMKHRFSHWLKVWR